MERVDAVQAAVRGRAGDAFIDAQAHLDWGYRSLGAWYQHITKVTDPAAKAHKAWAKRHHDHPLVMASLVGRGIISESWARQVIGWTSRLPEEFVAQADKTMTWVNSDCYRSVTYADDPEDDLNVVDDS